MVIVYGRSSGPLASANLMTLDVDLVDVVEEPAVRIRFREVSEGLCGSPGVAIDLFDVARL